MKWKQIVHEGKVVMSFVLLSQTKHKKSIFYILFLFLVKVKARLLRSKMNKKNGILVKFHNEKFLFSIFIDFVI